MKLVQWTPGTLASKNSVWPGLDREIENLMSWALGPAIAETPANGTTTRRLLPPMDLVEEKERYLVRFDLPGLKKEDLEVTFQDGLLSVRGERREEKREESEGKVVRRERYTGTFERSLRLPEKVDPARIVARFDHGVLELELPFLPEAQPVRLQIQ